MHSLTDGLWSVAMHHYLCYGEEPNKDVHYILEGLLKSQGGFDVRKDLGGDCREKGRPTWGEWGLLEFVRGVVGGGNREGDGKGKRVWFGDEVVGRRICFEGGVRRFVYKEDGTSFRNAKYGVVDGKGGGFRQVEWEVKKKGMRFLRKVLLGRFGLEGESWGERVGKKVNVVLFTRKKDAWRRHWEGSEEVMKRIERFPDVVVRKFDKMPGTFVEQVKLFHEADIVLGPHGAGMANALFMRTHTHILEIWRCCFDEDLNERIMRFPNLQLGWTSAFASKLDINLRYLACDQEFDEAGKLVPPLTKEERDAGEGICDVGKKYYSPFKYTTDTDKTFGKLVEAVLTFQGYQKLLAQKKWE